MLKGLGLISSLVIGFGGSALAQANPTPVPTPNFLRVLPSVLRSHATKAPLPSYPQMAIDAHTEGTAAADIFVNTDGSVFKVAVLEAPSEVISSGLAATLGTWKFLPIIPVGKSSPIAFHCVLVFYFNITDGQPTVIDAALAMIIKKNQTQAK